MRPLASLCVSLAAASLLAGCAAPRPRPTAVQAPDPAPPPVKHVAHRAPKPVPASSVKVCVPPAGMNAAKEEDLFRRFDQTQSTSEDDVSASR